MKEAKQITRLARNFQHIITCTDNRKIYNVEVINTSINNTRVSVGMLVGYKEPLGMDGHRDIIIKPNDSFFFNNIPCNKGEKVYIESTIKDICVVVNENS